MWNGKLPELVLASVAPMGEFKHHMVGRLIRGVKIGEDDYLPWSPKWRHGLFFAAPFLATVLGPEQDVSFFRACWWYVIFLQWLLRGLLGSKFRKCN